MEKIADRIRLAEMLSVYGTMLTDKQFKGLSMHFDDDFSLSEIGEELGVSRQAVYDLLSRGRQKLEEYEAELGVVDFRRKQRTALTCIYREIENLADGDNDEAVAGILHRLRPFVDTDQL